MSIVLVTGSSGLIGSEACRYFHGQGHDVVGIDNNLRAYFFGEQSGTAGNRAKLVSELKRYTHYDFDIRDAGQVDALFKQYGEDIALVVHTAAQPSHDWAAREPLTDFGVTAVGTLHLLS